MALQNFVDKVGPVVSAAWLNMVDVLATTVFGNAGDKATARTLLCSDAPLEVVNGGTGLRTFAANKGLGTDSGGNIITFPVPPTQTVIKTAGTSRSSNTTVTADPDLAITLAAGYYAYEFWLNFFNAGSTGATPGIQIGVFCTGTLPFLPPITFIYNSPSVGVGIIGPPINTSYGAPGDIFTNNNVIILKGGFQLTTSGTLSVNWAQKTSSANAVTLSAASWMSVVKMG